MRSGGGLQDPPFAFLRAEGVRRLAYGKQAADLPGR